MSPPSDAAGVRRLLGMVHHLGHFLPDASEATAPIRALFGKNPAWTWSHEQESAFAAVKDMLAWQSSALHTQRLSLPM